MPKRKKEENHVPDPTPERQLTSRSGWCADDLHDKCRKFFSFGKCGCKCDHKNKKHWTN